MVRLRCTVVPGISLAESETETADKPECTVPPELEHKPGGTCWLTTGLFSVADKLTVELYDLVQNKATGTGAGTVLD